MADSGRGVQSAAVRALLQHQAARAREYYARAAASLPSTDARRLVAAEIMAAIYFAILRKIERRGCDVFAEVAVRHLGGGNLRLIFPGFQADPANFRGFLRT